MSFIINEQNKFKAATKDNNKSKYLFNFFIKCNTMKQGQLCSSLYC